ncbi:hypothetical protein [Micromonospora sp. LOL_023]|uniref:hypothetical protein n=1 Tax=Micromonospora sp. LOL_023 TaxID=3345418 RepID=UPI003A85DF02
MTVMHLVGRERLWSAPQAVALALAFLVGSYLLAVPLHRWVELPAMRLLSRPTRTGPNDQRADAPDADSADLTGAAGAAARTR